MAATAADRLIDPTKSAKYPIILSDELLGRGSREQYTGVRLNHRPALSSDTAPSSAKLKPSTNRSYDLSFTDDGGKYAYKGSRSTDGNQCVLVFDPARKAFVLHRLDSTFNMNLTRTPENNDSEDLKQTYPYLAAPSTQREGTKGGQGSKASGGSKKSAPAKSRPSNAPAKQQVKAVSTPVHKEVYMDDDEDDEDDDGGGLLVEYPEGSVPNTSTSHNKDFSPAFPTRRFSEFVRDASDEEDNDDADVEDDEHEEEEEDEEEEEEDEGVSRFKLPSPVNGQGDDGGGTGLGIVDDFDDDDLEAELEKELDAEFNAVAGGGGGDAHGSESEVSEED